MWFASISLKLNSCSHGSDIEDTNGKLIHVKMLNEYPENQQIDHIFIDPVENYMELLLSITIQSCFFCKDPSHHQLPLHILVLIFIKHDEENPIMGSTT
jgi:hypothetical protein